MNVLNNVISSRNSLRQSFVKILRKSYSNMNNSDSIRGVSIEHIRCTQQKYGPDFPLVRPGWQHTVLYYLPSDGPPKEYPPKPLRGVDKWDYDHVRLPCSPQSEYVEEYSQTEVTDRWVMIKSALTSQITNSRQLAEAILKYNHSYRKTWKFTALHGLFENLDEDECEKFFHITLPAIAKLALALPDLIKSAISLLKQGQSHSMSLSQQQIACLLANAFFCTFPRRSSSSRKEYRSYPHINFTSLYESEPYPSTLEKLKCLIAYFVRVTRNTPEGVVTFYRRSVPAASCPRWEDSEMPLSRVPLHVDSVGVIERAKGLIQLDFANKYLGGGVLGHGCVQEEIRFVTCPELMVSMLFTQALTDTEALIIIGAERYSDYLGYGSTFVWKSSYTDDAPMDSSGRKKTAVLAIDALPFRNFADQYKKKNIDRELNKAWVGFSAYGEDLKGDLVNCPGVATGNWGCGAFRGSPPLKSLIQLMACAEARRPMAYFTFKDEKLRDNLIEMYNKLCRHNVTVGQLYRYILNFASSDVPKTQMFEYLAQVLQDGTRSAPAHGLEATTSRDLAEQVTPRHKDNAPRLESPDLFSQDEEQSQGTDKLDDPEKQKNQNQVNIKNRNGVQNSSETKVTDSYREYTITDSDAQIVETIFDTSDSELKMPDDSKLTGENSTKMSDNHTRLPDSSTSMFDSVTKLPDRSTKMSDSDIRNFVKYTKMPNKTCSDAGTSKTEVKITIEDSEDDSKTTKVKESHGNKNAASNKSLNYTSSLFEELQKFDDENGKLNLSITSTNTSSFAKKKRTMAALNDSDVSMETNEIEPPEPKKKMTSKITDYFKTNPI